MSLDFLSTAGSAWSGGAAPVARSPMERQAIRAGGRTDIRGRFSVVTDYGNPKEEAAACRSSVAWADVSHLGKLEVQASEAELAKVVGGAAEGVPLALGGAEYAAGAWWCPLTRTRLIVLCEPEQLPSVADRVRDAAGRCREPVSLTDVSTVYAAMTLMGPVARDTFARFCALDMRPHAMPLGAVRPVSVARQPGIVLREGEHRYLYLFGWAVADYVWTVVSDAARHLGGRPAGLDAIAPLVAPTDAARQEGLT